MSHSGEMPALVYLLSLVLLFGTILGIFFMRYRASAMQARARIMSEQAYQQLAEKAVAAQAETQALLSAIRLDIAKLAGSVAGVEKTLQQID